MNRTRNRVTDARRADVRQCMRQGRVVIPLMPPSRAQPMRTPLN